jgi:hypothetical protein
VLQKTPLGWATIDADWDGQIPKVDGRSTAARRAKRLAAEWVAQLGGPEVVDFATLAKVSGPLNYPVVADTARAMAMGGASVFDALVWIERLAEISRQRLQLDKPRKPPAPLLKDYVASRRPAS